MGYLRIVNWERQQHYGDRRTPPWIRLYNELLDDYRWGRLPDAAKAHLIGLYLLASRTGNVILDDPAWIANRIGADCEVALGPLLDAGFIARCDGTESWPPPDPTAKKHKRGAAAKAQKPLAALWENGASGVCAEESREEEIREEEKVCDEGSYAGEEESPAPPDPEEASTSTHTRGNLSADAYLTKCRPPTARAGRNPPGAAEVLAYARTIGFPEIDAERFLNFYGAKGWFAGASPITDWRPLVRNWRKTERFGAQPPRAGPTHHGNGRAQRKGALDCGKELMIRLAAGEAEP